jgi:hypothetical protein
LRAEIHCHTVNLSIKPVPIGQPSKSSPRQDFAELVWQTGAGSEPAAWSFARFARRNSLPEKVIDARLDLLCLTATTSLSVLAVEVLAGPLTFPANLHNANREPAAVGAQEDPLGANLNMRRILRTSPLARCPQFADPRAATGFISTSTAR